MGLWVDEMENNKNIYEHINDSEYLKINGYPLHSPYGLLRPIKVCEYGYFIKYITFLKKTSNNLKGLLFSNMMKETKNKDNLLNFKELLTNNEVTMFMHQNYFGTKDFIMDLINIVFVNDDNLDVEIMFYKITKNDKKWNEFRKYILSFNGIIFKDESGDSEIQRFNNLSNALKESKGDSINFESMFTSIMAFTGGCQPDIINNYTLYQFHAVFNRIMCGKNYDTSVLFKTVDSKGSIKITSWAKPKDDVLKSNEFVKLTSLSEKKEI